MGGDYAVLKTHYNYKNTCTQLQGTANCSEGFKGAAEHFGNFSDYQMTIKRKEPTGRKGWGGQGRGRRKSTDSQSSHGQEGRSPKGKQAPSQHAVATVASHTAHTASRFLCHAESQGKSHRDKREAQRRKHLEGPTCSPSLCHVP